VTPPEPVYRFGPLEQRGLLAGLRPRQVAVLASGTALSLGLVASTGSVAAALPAVALGGLALAATVVRVGPRTADQWLPLGSRHLWRLLRRRSRFVSEVSLLGHTSRGAAVSPPDTLRGVSVVTVDARTALPPGVPPGIGVLRDKRAGTCTGLLRVRGAAFTLLDVADQARAVDAWSAVLAGLAREPSPVRRLQWIERTLPETGEAAARHLGESAIRPFTDEAVRAYLGLIEEHRATGQVHEALVAVQVGRVRPGRGAGQPGDPDLATYVALARELGSLASRLGGLGLQVEGALPPGAVAQAVRVTFEPGAGRALALRAAGRGPSGLHPANAWPLAAATGWSSYRVGSAWHAVFWVREWPRTPVGPHFLAPLLLQTRCTRTVSVVMEPVPPGRARREAEAARVADASDEEIRQRAGFVTSARRRRELEQVLAREQELADGHADVRFSAYILVSASSPEDLDLGCAEVEQQAALARLELARLHGDQDRAFTYCLPLARGLR
jgi:hypothetical protein